MIMSAFLLSLAANAAFARGPIHFPPSVPIVPVLPSNPPSGTLTVVNDCDEAVAVRVNGGASRILEPAGQSSFQVPLGIVTSRSVPVHAELVSDPAVFADKDCKVVVRETTAARVSARSRHHKITLKISAGQPGVALLTREAGVMLCSGGGLGVLLMLSIVLGRGPRRRVFLVEPERSQT
jgi:hypothetical protein